MQIVINVPEEIVEYVNKNKCLSVIYNDALAEAIANGIQLPKGHGAIKDVSQIEIPMCEDRRYEKWVQVAINSAPTIIEADKESEK